MNICVRKQILHKKKEIFIQLLESGRPLRMVICKRPKGMKNAFLRPFTMISNVFWVSKNKMLMKKLDHDFHICFGRRRRGGRWRWGWRRRWEGRGEPSGRRHWLVQVGQGGEAATGCLCDFATVLLVQIGYMIFCISDIFPRGFSINVFTTNPIYKWVHYRAYSPITIGFGSSFLAKRILVKFFFRVQIHNL